MINILKNVFRPAPPRQTYSVPAGQRIYTIGDIHGRLDLFERLVASIERDDVRRGPAKTVIILLGDLIDRGPDSAGVIAAARELSSQRSVRILMGNHEEMFLKSFENRDVLREFVRSGGRETILSYNMSPDVYRALTIDELKAILTDFVPEDDIAFIRSFEDQIVIGDYVFVHAGIRPDVPLQEQSTQDMRWIREPFLSNTGSNGLCVVHGHSITVEPEQRPNRIGIDTGAYSSGRLTALGLEADRRWFL